MGCRFNEDNCRVELWYNDGRMISIDTLAVEEAVEANIVQRAALNYLLYNKPLEYADLILNGGLDVFLSSATKEDYGLPD